MSNADRDGPAFEGMTFYFDKPSELIAQAEALEWASRLCWSTIGKAPVQILGRALELRAQVQAEQPAEQGEPVAHVVTDIDGGNKRVCFYSNKALYETPVWAKLYAHPDPRIAALETLLQDILSEAQFPGSLVSMSNVMKERIEAALGKEGS